MPALPERASYSASVLFHAFAQVSVQTREIAGYRLFKNLPVEPGDIFFAIAS